MTWRGRRGHPPPEALRRRPRLSHWQKDVLRAFVALSSARQLVGMVGAPGPIPPKAIEEYAIRKGFADILVFDRFEYLIRALDGAYRERVNAEIERNSGGGGRRKPGRAGRRR